MLSGFQGQMQQLWSCAGRVAVRLLSVLKVIFPPLDMELATPAHDLKTNENSSRCNRDRDQNCSHFRAKRSHTPNFPAGDIAQVV